MNPTDVAEPQTLTSQQVVDLTRQHNYGTWRFQKNWNPMHIVDAEGCYIIDGAGKRYLDFSSQLMCSNLGHKNQAVIDAIARQAQQLSYAMPGYATTARAELSQLLVEILPKALNKFFFTTSGTEANEAAFKIARMYTGKTKIIARYRSYHGSTAGSIAATGDPRRWAMEPGGKGPGIIFAPEVHCYKCPIRHTYPGCGIACADYIEHMIRNESDVAAVLVEPIVGTNGVIVPPDEYMPKLRRICDENGVLLIADEVMTGMGRTGRNFAVEHWLGESRDEKYGNEESSNENISNGDDSNLAPDILVTAKGLSSGYAPLGAVIASKKVIDAIASGSGAFLHGFTYNSHPISLAAGRAVLHHLQSTNLIAAADSSVAGTAASHLKQALESLRGEDPRNAVIGDVRGLGLLWAVEFVAHQKSKRPFAPELNFSARVASAAMSRGLLVYPMQGCVDGISGDHLLLAPPAVITREEITWSVTQLRSAVDEAASSLR